MELEKALREYVKNLIPEQMFVGTVIEVDLSNYTCTVAPIDGGAEYHFVRLKPTADGDDHGFVIVPELQSFVIVGILKNDRRAAFVIHFTNIKTVLIKNSNDALLSLEEDGTMKLNGDSLGGLVKVNDLLTRMNNIEDAHNALVGTFNLHTHPSNGTPTSNASSAQSNSTLLSDLENTRVKQG